MIAVEAPADASTDSPHRTTHPIVCSDSHNIMNSLDDLKPYLSRSWQAKLNLDLPPDANKFRFRLPMTHYTSPIGGLRDDTVPPDGSFPGSHPGFFAHQMFGDHGISCTVLIPTEALFMGSMAFPDTAAEIVRALNDLTIDRWLSADPRYMGSIAVAPQDPDKAVAEIYRLADHPQMVQVLIPTFRIRMGNRYFHSIFAAAEEVGLPVGWHVGGESAGVMGPLTALGVPSSYIEHHASVGQIAQAQVISMICEGVFEKFPKLKFACVEGGVAWLPHVMWRLHREWLSAGDELPWMKRSPMEYFKEHIYVSTQPLEEPPDDARKMVQLLGTVDAQDFLIYSSDYPHHDFDNPAAVFRAFPAEWKRKIMFENPSRLYPRVASFLAAA
jgi:predicted TIM-barrel fold metal-dependent hydrolase